MGEMAELIEDMAWLPDEWNEFPGDVIGGMDDDHLAKVLTKMGLIKRLSKAQREFLAELECEAQFRGFTKWGKLWSKSVRNQRRRSK